MNAEYRRYHAKWHRERLPIFWWLRRPAYTKFITRELTSVAVGYVAVLLILQIRAVGLGEEAYRGFSSWLGSRPAMVLHGLVLLVLLFHTVTWLNLAPKALVLRLGGKRAPDALVLAGHYAAWILASAVVAWLALGRM